jgi:hypothetical protein
MAKTTNYNLEKPTVGSTGWGADVNANFDTIDTQLKTATDNAATAQSTANAKQAALVSGTNIKTLNSTSLLGSGDIAITVPVKATGAELNTGTDDAKFATAKGLADSDYAKTTDIPVKAIGSEADTGTDDAKFLTAKAAKDSHNIPSVAPSTSGNVLTSNGTDWTSAAPASGATKCTGVEIDTGTDDAKFATPKAIADSALVSETAWTDYSSTSTVVGWAPTPTKNIRYKKIGNTVFVSFDIRGTSSANNITFTLPYSAATGSYIRNPVYFTDAGTSAYPAMAAISSDTVSVTKDWDATDKWATSGNKLVQGQFFYEAA